VGGLGRGKQSHSLDHEHLLQLTPRKAYEKIMKAASDRLPELDDEPHDLYQYLFDKDDLEWLRKKYHARQRT
jgi:hypothetical protein